MLIDNTTNELVICKDDYENENEWKDTIRDAVMLLLNAGYVSVVRYDEKELGIVVIEYNYANREYGDKYPCWLYQEEEDIVSSYREDNGNNEDEDEDYKSDYYDKEM